MRATWSSEDCRAYRIGAALRDCCIALGGWVDWSADGSVRFLCRGADGNIGVNFPAWLIAGMREYRKEIKRFIELVKAEDDAWIKHYRR